MRNTPAGDGEPQTVQKADLWGVANSVQARRIGMYNYACLKNRPFVHTIEADVEYLVCNKGDWIQYAGDIALAGSTQGRIKGVIWADGACVGVDTDEPLVMGDGKQYAVWIRLSDGAVILKDAVFSPGKRREKSIPYHPGEGGEPYEPFVGELYAVGEDNACYEPENAVFFTEPLGEAGAPKAGDVYAFGARGYEALDLVITDVQPGQNFTAVLTCVEYAPEIFGVDGEGFVLPDFVNKITPVSGAVDSGAVNPDRWRSFYAYHDGEDEPAPPQGNGQDGGWHHMETCRSVWQSSKLAESVESGEWGPPVRIRAERGSDDITPIWLSLSPQNVKLETDPDRNVMAGLLPLTIQARLHKWNSVLSGVAFSLAGAPSGVTVNSSGVITVSAGAALGDADSITVRAAYQGAEYAAALSIEKSINNGAPRYLGTVTALSANAATVTVIKGPAAGQAEARQGDYVLATAAAVGRPAGSVFQWGGIAWEYRAPENHSDLYVRCFKDGLDVPALSQDMGWFGAVFAKLLVALKAFIESLEALAIKLRAGGVIYGGDKYLENGYVNPNAPAGAKGFWLGANGEAKLEEATVSGKITAKSGTFHGRIEADEGELNNVTIKENCTVKGKLALRDIGVTNTNVTAGDKLLKSMNHLVVLHQLLGTIYFPNNVPIKVISTIASGTCLVRVRFPSYNAGAERNLPKYKIAVNGDTVVSFGSKSITLDIDYDHIITLSANRINTVALYGDIGGQSLNGDHVWANTTFELRIAESPGILGLLG